MEQSTQEQLAKSLTAQTTALLPHLPYLLQDFWSLGIDPGLCAGLVGRHVERPGSARILDLACGKGAVSVKLAEKLRVQVKGIDILPAFVEVAARKAREFHVDDLCEFAVGDVNEAVKVERGYDCVVYGAIGDVLGGRLETLNKLKETVKPGGYLLLDNYDFIDEAQWTALFRQAGLEPVEVVCDDDAQECDGDEGFELVSDGDLGVEAIAGRAGELIRRYPDQKAMFEQYVESQRREYEEIGNMDRAVCVTWMLKKPDGRAR